MTHISDQYEHSKKIHMGALQQQYLRGLIPSQDDGSGPLLPIQTPHKDNQEMQQLYHNWLVLVAENQAASEVLRNNPGYVQ